MNNKQKILKVLGKELKMTREVAEAVGVAYTTAERHLLILLGEGKIEKVKVGGGKLNNLYGWRLKK